MLGQLALDRQHGMQGRHRILKDHCNVPSTDGPEAIFRQVEEIATPKHCCSLDPRAGRGKAHNSKGTSSLAAAALARDAEYLSGQNPEVDTVENRRRATTCSKLHAKVVNVEQGFDHHRPVCDQADLGSSASRKLSPRKALPTTSVKIANPGAAPNHH